ncbi:hypothetical protein CIPAW_07G208000 [Carya illinoinensis]|uniref:Uncharacterized protein n=1 Tax=Carya illinoinensis TaxID=32201 RepID=A0A8T1PYM3_CARIL|nr:hypothetical protein CIPAW_07G208000 [Carya illinoinensis]
MITRAAKSECMILLHIFIEQKQPKEICPFSELCVNGTANTSYVRSYAKTLLLNEQMILCAIQGIKLCLGFTSINPADKRVSKNQTVPGMFKPLKYLLSKQNFPMTAHIEQNSSDSIES